MSDNLPPYPRFGECIAVLAGAFDIKKAGSDVGRLARAGDFDWERLDAVVDVLLIDGLTGVIGDAARRVLLPWLTTLRDDYTAMVLDVPLDGLDRAGALPILVDTFFAPAVADLLWRAHGDMPGPELGQLTSADRNPLEVTFQWLDELLGQGFEKVLYPQSVGPDRVEQEKLRKWRTGVDTPSTQSLKLLRQGIQRSPMEGKDAAVALWMTLASALTRTEKTAGPGFKPQVCRHLSGGRPDRATVRSRLEDAVARVAVTWPTLALAGQRLWFDLKRTTPKRPGDRARAWQAIDALQAQADTHDPQGRTAYHYPWMRGRWHVLSGDYQEALPHYQRAYSLACYRAGYQLKDLIREATCIAAFLEKRPFLKQLKHVGIALGLFQKQPDTAVLEEWEIEQLARQLPLLFPPTGRFTEAPSDWSHMAATGLMQISQESVARFQPDLQSPNRVRAVHFEDGSVRRWPQLRIFSSFGRAVEVAALLQAGATVDALDSSGASALLCALQHAEATGDRAALDLLLAQPHLPVTLNAVTRRKRLTPLMCAIDYGAPDVVKALLIQGAAPNQRALTDDLSPLYQLCSRLLIAHQPQRAAAILTDRALQEPDLVMQDTMRRFGIDMAGTFGADTNRMRSTPGLVAAIAKQLMQQHARQRSASSLMEIAALLLEAGAQPNAAHAYPARGRTPLMLAAENDLPELFDLMCRHGGEPRQPDAAGHDCWHIARSFGAVKVMAYLQRMAR